MRNSGSFRTFVDAYLNYDFKNVGDRWATALNLTTDVLQNSAYDVIRKENRVGLVEAGQSPIDL